MLSNYKLSTESGAYFQVQAVNKAGKSDMSERTAVRTLPSGAQPMSPWVEVIDDRTNKLFYCHSKTNAVAWSRPAGSILDDTASFKIRERIYKTRWKDEWQKFASLMG